MDCESDESDRWEDFFGKPKCRSISQIPKKTHFFCKSTACLRRKKKWTQNQKRAHAHGQTHLWKHVCACVFVHVRECVCVL